MFTRPFSVIRGSVRTPLGEVDQTLPRGTIVAMSSSQPLPPYASSSAPTAAPASYAFVTDRAEIHRWHGGIVGLHAALAAAIVALMVVMSHLVDSSGLGTVALLPFLILLVGQTFQLSVHCYLWGARAAISRPAVVDAHGITFALAIGTVRLPWEALQRVDLKSSLFSKVLVFRLRPGVEPGVSGVFIDVKPRQLARMQRLGISLGLRGLQQTPEEVRAVIASASGGRFLV